jgi:glycosyltransferase involved in cell wall biosynthesis
LRLLFVSNGFPPSGQWGTEFYTHQLATGLLRRGHDVSVLHPVRDGTRPRYTLESRRIDGVPVTGLHNAGDPLKRFADSYENARIERLFADLLARDNPDVVHFTHFLWGLSARLPILARAHGAGVVVSLTDYGLLCHRGQLYDWKLEPCPGPGSAATCARCVREPSPFDEGRPLLAGKRAAVRALAAMGGLGAVVGPDDIRRRRDVIASVIPSVDRWIAPTRTLAAKFAGHGFPRERMEILVYGIDESAFVRPLRTQPGGSGAPDGVLRFGFMGQFTPHKGLDKLLDAVRILMRRKPESDEPWVVELYGHASEDRHKRYLDAVLTTDLRDRVHWMGSFEPLAAPRILERLSAIIVPSQWTENAPLTVLQARAAGVPIIASDVPGVREVLDDGVHGILVPRGDVRALADAMGRFVAQSEPRALPIAPKVSYADHLARVEAIYGELRAPLLAAN